MVVYITKKENKVLTCVHTFDPKYKEGIPLKVLQTDLDVHEHNLHDVLKSLAKKELITYEHKKIKLINESTEIKTLETKEDVRNVKLDIKEANVVKIIREVVDEDNLVPKYILEGHLLYGPEKITNFRMYHIILSLEIKGVIKKVKKKDGRYYKLIN
ncbi:MAG: hypothetical protein PHC65_04315 [Methanobacteriaceae archaeon]|jgi:hypothetical protein|uniref:hypothetical protein n=1 Tax=unclassified Methanobrevibacter TaxID=2638681 RepID=UPI002A114596|nr:hypothetical protein [Methanobacteriaceae archaeon]MDD3408143.1 hypothetical protein [Methanobacteriaceae archaeon]MDD4594197.1 hypothetical protein [Methanobacteriaceae archaeon]